MRREKKWEGKKEESREARERERERENDFLMRKKRKFYEMFTSHPYPKLVVYNLKFTIHSPSFCRSLILFF